MNYKEIREECVAANKELQSLGLIDITFGNVSIFDPETRVFAIKPSGVPYDALTPEQMVIVDLEGKTVEGDLRPSSDEPTHRRLFIELGDKGITSVVHTHSRNAVGFAQAERGIPCLGTTHCDYFRGTVPVTRPMTEDEVAGAYEWETGNVIVELFSEVNPLEVNAALVRNHGPFVWGKNGAKAVETAFALEIVADMAAKTLALNPEAKGAPAHLLKKHYDRKHGPGAYYGQK